MSLYQITAEMVSLLHAFDQHGEDSPEAEAAFREHASALAEAFDSKADDYAALIRVCETRSEARRHEAARMKALADSDEVLSSRLRETMRAAMEATGRVRVDTPRFRLAVRTNGGKIPVVIEDEAALPAEFAVPVVTVRPDRDAIRSALEAGKPVAGARLGQRGTRLDIQ